MTGTSHHFFPPKPKVEKRWMAKSQRGSEKQWKGESTKQQQQLLFSNVRSVYQLKKLHENAEAGLLKS